MISQSNLNREWINPAFKPNIDAPFFKLWISPLSVQGLLNNLNHFKCAEFISDNIVIDTVNYLKSKNNEKLLISILYFAKSSFDEFLLKPHDIDTTRKIQTIIDNLIVVLETNLPNYENEESKKTICTYKLDVALKYVYNEHFLKNALILVKNDKNFLAELCKCYNEKYQKTFGIIVDYLLE